MEQQIIKNWQSHRWSGYPGAYCLECGIEDPIEFAVGTCYSPQNGTWNKNHPQYNEAKNGCESLTICPSKRSCNEAMNE